MNTERLSWLGGFMDGEAWVGISSKPSYQKNNPTLYEPVLQISNTSKTCISQCAEIMQENSIAYYLKSVPARKDEHKPQEAIVIRGIRRNMKALWVIEPYLVGKNLQARFVMTFCYSRLLKTIDRRGSIDGGGLPYTQEEKDIYYALKEMNVRGSTILNEYTQRATPFVAMMYSELRAKGAEVAEMTTRSEKS